MTSRRVLFRSALGGALAVTALCTAACGDGDSGSAATDTASTATDASGAADGCSYTPRPGAESVALPGADAPSGQVPMVLHTNAGDIPMTLDADRAPCTVNAITHLAKDGFYDGVTCHRLTTKGIYVLQCGDPLGTGTGGPGFSFADEYPVGSGESPMYAAGTVAMANAGPDTNGSQFFLNYADSPLPPSYTLFGTVDPSGLAVLNEIAAKGAAGGAPDGPPAEPVVIERAEVG